MSRCSERSPAAHDTILRFVTTERLLHWAIAIPFLGCFVSAVVLVVVYNPDPTRAYRPLFAWMHRGCGAGLILFPSLVLLASVRHVRIHLDNIRQAWLWTVDDIKWLALMGLAAISRRIVLPDQGKFNAAEKLNFMMVMVLPPCFIATGVLIWFPDSTTLGAFFPWMVHCGLAALATPLLLGHIIMATINPSTRVGLSGMISGFVSREWAAHHYARWFREQFPDLAPQHASKNTRDAGETAPDSAGAELWPPPLADAWAAAAPPHNGITRAAARELDGWRRTGLLAGAVVDVVAEIHQPDCAVDDAVDDAEEVALPARDDARTAPDAACGADPQME